MPVAVRKPAFMCNRKKTCGRANQLRQVAGFAGVVLASRMTSGQPTTSEGFALEVIAACVLGGVSLTGGVGTMSGVIVGVLIMGTVQNAMDLLNVPTFYQYVARGSILLAAVLFDQLKHRNVQHRAGLL